MNTNTAKYIRESSIVMARRKVAGMTVAALLSLSLAAGTALAGDHGRRAGEYHERGDYESRIYGLIEKLPQDRVGAWVVNGREIVVTKDSWIREKHGKAEVGAYVEVEGNVTGKAFTAYEVKVKRSKLIGR